MQQPPSLNCHIRAIIVIGGFLTGCTGCTGPTSTGSTAAPDKPHKGAALKLSCPDPAFAAALKPLVRGWANRSGAAVEIVSAPMTPADAVDLGVLAAAELGTWADRGDLAPVPPQIRNGDNPYQWLSVLAVYRNQVTSWGGQLVALPLAGDGHVVVYRADRFADKPTAEKFAKERGRPLAAPASWEDFAETAEFFTKLDGKPCLAGLPDDPRKLADEFLRVAACFDRPALNESRLAAQANDPNFGTKVLSFEFKVDDGAPRIAERGFVAAGEWLARLKPCRGGSADAVAALAEGRAVMAVLALDEVAKLPKENGAVPPRFAVAALPGARTYFDDAGKPVPPEAASANYVPYFAGGKVGAVRKSSANATAAFDLLAELSGPDGSQQILSTTGLGAGPFRSTHIDRDRLMLWYGYGFDADQSKALQDALRSFAGVQVGNPTFGPRGPDHASLAASLATELKKIASGETPPADGLKRAAAAWASDASAPADVRLKWRRRAAGVN